MFFSFLLTVVSMPGFAMASTVYVDYDFYKAPSYNGKFFSIPDAYWSDSCNQIKFPWPDSLDVTNLTNTFDVSLNVTKGTPNGNKRICFDGIVETFDSIALFLTPFYLDTADMETFHGVLRDETDIYEVQPFSGMMEMNGLKIHLEKASDTSLKIKLTMKPSKFYKPKPAVIKDFQCEQWNQTNLNCNVTGFENFGVASFYVFDSINDPKHPVENHRINVFQNGTSGSFNTSVLDSIKKAIKSNQDVIYWTVCTEHGKCQPYKFDIKQEKKDPTYEEYDSFPPGLIVLIVLVVLVIIGMVLYKLKIVNLEKLKKLLKSKFSRDTTATDQVPVIV